MVEQPMNQPGHGDVGLGVPWLHPDSYIAGESRRSIQASASFLHLPLRYMQCTPTLPIGRDHPQAMFLPTQLVIAKTTLPTQRKDNENPTVTLACTLTCIGSITSRHHVALSALCVTVSPFWSAMIGISGR